jgi:hypothetical protein
MPKFKYAIDPLFNPITLGSKPSQKFILISVLPLNPLLSLTHFEPDGGGDGVERVFAVVCVGVNVCVCVCLGSSTVSQQNWGEWVSLCVVDLPRQRGQVIIIACFFFSILQTPS